MDIKSLTLAISALVLSTSVNASIVNTLNGVDYEWLELSATQGLSRIEVEANIAAAQPGDLLYGYEYASRSLVSDLYASYATYTINGNIGNPSAVEGVATLVADFGPTFVRTGLGYDHAYFTADGYTIYHDYSYSEIYAIYGTNAECSPGDSNLTCVSQVGVSYNAAGNPTMANMRAYDGWDETVPTTHQIANNSAGIEIGSLLVRTAVVPVPASAWLLGSGLLGLIGVARRKKS